MVKSSLGLAVIIVGIGTVALWYISGIGQGQDEIHLLPSGYTGPVYVILGAQDGVPRSNEGEARLYSIPASGVLKTQFGPNEGYKEMEFYYAMPHGDRKPVAFAQDSTVHPDSIQVFAVQSGWIRKGETSFIRYVVGRKTNEEQLIQQMYGIEVDSL